MSTKVVFALAMLVAGSAWAVEVDLPKADAPFPPVDETEEVLPEVKPVAVSGTVAAPEEKKEHHEQH